MTLGVWMYFWTEADWVPAPAEEGVPDAPLSRGGAGYEKRKRRKEYERLDDTYWEIRARYLRRLDKVKAVEPTRQETPPPSPAKIAKFDAMAAAALRRATAARTRAELQLEGARYVAARLRLEQSRRWHNDSIALLLLLSEP